MSEDYVGDLGADEARARTWAIIAEVAGLDINEALAVLASAVATIICNSAPSQEAMRQKLVETAKVLLRAAEFVPEAMATRAEEIRLDRVH